MELNFPLHRIVLETTRRCNLRCIHCAVSEENNLGTYDARDLSMEVFRKLLPIFTRFTPLVQLSGHGETFLHPNFIDMLEDLTGIGCQVCFQTNGTLLTTKNIEQLVRSGVRSIAISLDAASPALFQHIRRRASLERILQNIRSINATKRRLAKHRPNLGFEFVAMRQNIHELPDVVRLAAELEVTYVQVAELHEYNLTRGQSLANDALMAEWVNEAELEARRLGLDLVLPPNIPRRQIAGPFSDRPSINPTNPTSYRGLRKTCTEAWESMFVQFNGEVRPCCVIGESYGDLSVQSVEEVWYGAKYEALRASLLTDTPLAECVTCPFYGWEPMAVPRPGGHPAAAAEQNTSAASATGGSVDLTSLTSEVSGGPALPGKGKLLSLIAFIADCQAGFPSAWHKIARALNGGRIQLSAPTLLWLLNRLNSPDVRKDFTEVRARNYSLADRCATLLCGGESISEAEFVQRCYRKLLGRRPDERGMMRHAEALTSTRQSRAQVVDFFLSSEEFRTIARALSGGRIQLSAPTLLWLLARLNSPDVRKDFTGVRARNHSLADRCVTLLCEDEWISEVEFVERCYRKLLGRKSDEPGMIRHVEALTSTRQSRAQVVDFFLSSEEFQHLLQSIVRRP